jgi:hypothetical protein
LEATQSLLNKAKAASHDYSVAAARLLSQNSELRSAKEEVLSAKERALYQLRIARSQTKPVELPTDLSSHPFLVAKSFATQHFASFLLAMAERGMQLGIEERGTATSGAGALPAGVPAFAIVASANTSGTVTLAPVPSSEFLAASPDTFSTLEVSALVELLRWAEEQPENRPFRCFGKGEASAGARQVVTRLRCLIS